MPPKIIVDGYNLLHASSNLNTGSGDFLEKARNRLIEKLGQYKKLKRASITVVFDGWQGGLPMESREMMRGIKITYSKLGEKADQVIMRMIADSSQEIIVVSSDREIRDFAEKYNFLSVSSSEFLEKLEMAAFLEMKGGDEEEYEQDERKVSTRKKGNPKKLPKAERKKRAKLKKL